MPRSSPKCRLALCLLGATCIARAQQDQPDPIPAWMAANAIRLTTAEAGHGFADMQPLKKVVGSARIVALGEATHGTREFFQLKHRMMEFLAAEMGFTVFSIEANMPEAYRLNDYVLNGAGDPAALIKGMYFWTWDTQEVLEMVKWMREFNRSGKGRVEFTGFDMQTPTVAVRIADEFVAKHDPGYAETLRKASDTALRVQATAQAAEFGGSTGTFPVKEAAGKRVRFSGFIRTQDVTGYAGLWWRVDGASGVLTFENLKDRAPKGTTDWKEYALEIPVAAEAKNINFGMLLSGAGTAWFDGLSVELDGQPYRNASLFDFDFESDAPRGFPTFGAGYRAQLDREVFHSGKQSLQVKRVAAPSRAAATNQVDPKTASAEWMDIVEHMKASREAYLQNGATAKDIDWATQTARVVLQCMQMRASQVTRDQSMAENVKWILDHSPSAKIVLWAHNGHVSAGGGGFDSMGAALRKMYPGQMVVFGFAFNQGSFQAISQGKGLLKDFTVPPAPEGSLDAALAATGIPVFALDLRPVAQAVTAPAAVAAWFGAAHKTRSIGALYPEDSPFAFMEDLVAPQSFDALLFVASTTAARKNSPLLGINSAPHPSEFRDAQYGVAFRLPEGWRIADASRWGDRETTVTLSLPRNEATASVYFQIRDTALDATVEEMQKKLPADMEAKARSRVEGGTKNYRIRPDSCQARTVSGKASLTCIADFDDSGTDAAEYLTYVVSGKATLLVFARIRATELEPFRESLDKLVESIKIP